MLSNGPSLALSPPVCQPRRFSPATGTVYWDCMPIYDYRCTNGHRFEVLQRIVDEPLTECEVCGAPAVRVLHPVAIHFKGSGFYSTDYGRGKKSASERAEAAGESKSKDGDSKTSETKKSSDSDSKPSSSEPKKAAEG
jgi:putative FmdB family regulatory protein